MPPVTPLLAETHPTVAEQQAGVILTEVPDAILLPPAENLPVKEFVAASQPMAATEVVPKNASGKIIPVIVTPQPVETATPTITVTEVRHDTVTLPLSSDILLPHMAPLDDAPDDSLPPIMATEVAIAPESGGSDIVQEVETQLSLLTVAQFVEAVTTTETAAEAPEPIAVAVAESIAALPPSEQEAIAPTLATIQETIQAITALEGRVEEADPIAVQQLQEKLQELCIELFDALGISDDEAAVVTFIEVLLGPAFVEKLLALQTTDGEGTRERTFAFPAFGTLAALVAVRIASLQKQLGNYAITFSAQSYR